jgi:hypothetical protein
MTQEMNENPQTLKKARQFEIQKVVRDLKKSKLDEAGGSLKVEKLEKLLLQLRNTSLDDLATIALTSLGLSSVVEEKREDVTPAARRILAVKCVVTLLHTADVEALHSSTSVQPSEISIESENRSKKRKMVNGPRKQAAGRNIEERSRSGELESAIIKNSNIETNGDSKTTEDQCFGESLTTIQPRDQGTVSEHVKQEGKKGTSNLTGHVAKSDRKKSITNKLKKSKNRLGQRARRKLFLSGAEHGVPGSKSQMQSFKNRASPAINKSTNKKEAATKSGNEKLHPSWELKRKQARLEKPQGKRTIFNDDT